jgi:hypothetical protein
MKYCNLSIVIIDEISMQCIAQLNTHKVNVIAFDTVQAGVTANLKVLTGCDASTRPFHVFIFENMACRVFMVPITDSVKILEFCKYNVNKDLK